jgi:rod shape-determining protein MreD
VTTLGVVIFLLSLLWLQIALGQFGPLGWDWSLCGFLVLCLRFKAPAYISIAIALGLVRDSLSVVPLGAQALGLAITAVVLLYFSRAMFLENFLIKGMLFFVGYLIYQVVFFFLGKCLGFLDAGFLEMVSGVIPKAFVAGLICYLMTVFLPGLLPARLKT